MYYLVRRCFVTGLASALFSAFLLDSLLPKIDLNNLILNSLKFFQGLRPLTLSWALPLDHSLLALTYGVIANIFITGLFHLQTARKLYYNSHNCSWQHVDLYKQTCSPDLLDAGNLLCQCSLSDSHVPMVQFQKESISVFRT